MAKTSPKGDFKPLSPRRAGQIALLLVLSCVGFTFYFYEQLFGGSGWVSLGLFVSLLVTLGAHALIVFTRAEPCGPEGLAGSVTWIRDMKRPLIVVLAVVAIVWGISAPTFFLSARLAGGAESGPLFAPRDVYRLESHGVYTEVSALRFWTVGLSGAFWMYSTFLSFALLALYSLLFGDPSGLWEDDSKT